MTTISRCIGPALLAAVGFANFLQAAEPAAGPDFKEVQAIVRQQLSGATDESLNRAAVDGLLMALKGRVTVVTNVAPRTNLPAALVAKETVFDGNIGYVRIRSIEPGVGGSLAGAVKELTSSNTLSGLVLDLRFTSGEDYAAAAGVVDLFLSKEVPLLNAGHGLISSQEKTNTIRLPVVALVNGETSAAAEAVAAVLRQAGAGLLIGNRTAGRAGVTADFKLSSGQTLRIVTAPVQLGDAKAIPTTGVVPDIEVPAKPEDERTFQADPFTMSNGVKGLHLSSASTNGTTNVGAAKRVRVTEADLVRERRREIDNPEGRSGKTREAEAEAPTVQDPVLSRAIDLLKGLAVVRQGHF